MRKINITYYDAVLSIIPIILFTIPTGIRITGMNRTTGLIAAGILSIIVTAHALFVNKI